jgi:hypothetical protein
VVLKQKTKQLTAVDLQVCLQLGVGQRGGLGAIQEGQHCGELLAACTETVGLAHGQLGRAHRVLRRVLTALMSWTRPASPAASSEACAAR